METLERLLPRLFDGAWTSLILLFFASALPLLVLWAALAWRRPAAAGLPFLTSVVLGVFTVPLALLLTLLAGFVFRGPLSGPLAQLLQTPTGEELGRFIIYIILLLPVAGIESRRNPAQRLSAAAVLVALVGGMAFSAIETAMYAPQEPFLLFLRSIFSWPIHAACSILVARAVLALRRPEGPAGRLRILWLPVAIAIHAAWNAALSMPQLFLPLALSSGCVLLVVLALKKGR